MRWGRLRRRQRHRDDDNCRIEDGVFSIVIGNGRPPMGQLALPMPPRNVRGVDTTAVSSTQLLGGSSEDDMILGHQVSSRLARRVGWPIFVSCSLCWWGGDRGAEGGGVGGRGGRGVVVNIAGGFHQIRRDLASRAAALAEREASRILLREKEMLSGMT